MSCAPYFCGSVQTGSGQWTKQVGIAAASAPRWGPRPPDPESWSLSKEGIFGLLPPSPRESAKLSATQYYARFAPKFPILRRFESRSKVREPLIELTIRTPKSRLGGCNSAFSIETKTIGEFLRSVGKQQKAEPMPAIIPPQ